jgi:transglutaminase-like putative cysteine protease
MRRLFDSWVFLTPVGGAALATHVVCWIARKRNLNAIFALIGPVLVLAATIAWFRLPDTTYYGVPTTETLRTAGDLLNGALEQFRTVIAPTEATEGFLLASIIGAVLVAALADWAAFRMRATLEATIPSFGLFIFVAALGTSEGRTAAIAVEVAALLIYLLVYQVTRQDRTTGWVANRSTGAGRSVLKTGLVIGAAAVALAVALGPNLPGADSEALVAWRSRSGLGDGSRSTVSPLVDIRGRLVDRAQTEVFTVRSPTRAYWRLTSLDTFDGTIWSSNESYKSVKSTLSGDALPFDDTEQTVQVFTIGSLDSIWLPAAYEPVRVDGIKKVSYSPVSGSLISSKETANGLTYTVTSILPHLTADMLKSSAPPDPAEVGKFRELPDVPVAVRNLAANITRGKLTDYDKAKAIQDYLRKNYTYSTDVQLGHNGSAITEFLFGTDKKGYCEQFAGSYAVLARAVGLPTRIAVGFTAGTATDDGLLHVKDEHAHAWPEVYFSSAGWVAFEPTPGRGVPGATSYTGVVDPDAKDQPDTTTATTAASTATTETTSATTSTTVRDEKTLADGEITTEKGRSLAVTVLMVLAGLLLLAVLWAVLVPQLRRMQRRRRWQSARGPADRVLLAWEDANELLAQAGAGRAPHETFFEHARRAGPKMNFDPDTRTALQRLAGDAAAANYGDDGVGTEVADRAASSAAAVEEAVLAQGGRRQRFLWSIDPRPLVGAGSASGSNSSADGSRD